MTVASPSEMAAPDDGTTIVAADEAAPPAPETGSGARSPRPGPRPLTPARIGVAVLVWLVVTATVIALVIYGVGPLLEQRDQDALLDDYRQQIEYASNREFTVVDAAVPIEAPSTGTPVAIIDIPDIGVEQVVVEGVGPQQTRKGPGHVPGTAGPGQPGNSAIVARRSAFGGVFRQLDHLERGDEILVTTTQGQSVYDVTTVRTASIGDGDQSATLSEAPAEQTTTSTGDPAAPVRADDPAAASTTTASPALPSGDLTIDDLYGPSEDDRLTLVTSVSLVPWSTDRASVVVAELKDIPFEPTPQGGRTDASDGRSADPSAWAPLALAGAFYLIAIVAAVVLYRRARPRSAYLLTAPPILAATMLVAEATARTLPAWF
jgi:sortase A